jgi:hypothetical protein
MAIYRFPDSVRYLDIFGVEYFIPWEDLQTGGSFFLKTTATAAQVKKALRPAMKHLKMTLVPHARLEFGYYGVRVWRLA